MVSDLQVMAATASDQAEVSETTPPDAACRWHVTYPRARRLLVNSSRRARRSSDADEAVVRLGRLAIQDSPAAGAA